MDEHDLKDTELKAKDRTAKGIGINLVRGALIGTVETVPGVSGGTVALVVGVYERLIGAASTIISALKLLATGIFTKNAEARTEGMSLLKNLPWALLLAIGGGMVIAVGTMAHLMSHLVDTQPRLTSAAFFGMVLASLYVPYQLAGRWRGKDWIYALVAASIMYFVVSLPPAGDLSNPAWYIVILAAAVAISALILPGLSGSFLLLTFGLYEVTMNSVKDLDLGYLTLFGTGALLGLATVVKGLEWLLTHHHHVLLVVLTGVMFGALRALWPWTTEDNQLLPVGDQAGAVLLWCVIGFVLVAAVIVADKIMSPKPTVYTETLNTVPAPGEGK